MGRVQCASWSPDSTLLALSTGHRSVLLWKVSRSGSELYRELKSKDDAVQHITWSPDSSMLAATVCKSSTNKTLWVWSVARGGGESLG